MTVRMVISLLIVLYVHRINVCMYGSGQPYKCMVSTWLQGYTSGGVVQFYTAQAQQEGSSTDKAQHRKRNVAQAQQEESGTAK